MGLHLLEGGAVDGRGARPSRAVWMAGELGPPGAVDGRGAAEPGGW